MHCKPQVVIEAFNTLTARRSCEYCALLMAEMEAGQQNQTTGHEANAHDRCGVYRFWKDKHFSAALRSRNYSLQTIFFCPTVKWPGYLRAGSRRWSRQSPPGWGWWEGWPAGWCWSWRSPGTSWPRWARSCGSPASGRPGRKTARCAAWAARTGGRGELSKLAFNLRFQFQAWLHMFRHINNTTKKCKHTVNICTV